MHGVDSALRVSGVGERNSAADAFISACVQEGIEENDDFNGGSEEGAATAYLRVVQRRNNEALALRVVFEGTKAVGIKIPKR